MTATMILMDLQMLAVPLAFAAMLVASLILFRRTRRWHFAVQAAGFGLLVGSQLFMLLSYQVFPAVIGTDGGLVANEPREKMWLASIALNIIGFTLCGIGYSLQAFRHDDSPNNSFKPTSLRDAA